MTKIPQSNMVGGHPHNLPLGPMQFSIDLGDSDEYFAVMDWRGETASPIFFGDWDACHRRCVFLAQAHGLKLRPTANVRRPISLHAVLKAFVANEAGSFAPMGAAVLMFGCIWLAWLLGWASMITPGSAEWWQRCATQAQIDDPNGGPDIATQRTLIPRTIFQADISGTGSGCP